MHSSSIRSALSYSQKAGPWSRHLRLHTYGTTRVEFERTLSQPVYERGRTSVCSCQDGTVEKYPALAVAHPFGGVKEQTAGIYATKMVEKGYVTLAFDVSHQGENGVYHRDTENPTGRMENIRCAVSKETSS